MCGWQIADEASVLRRQALCNRKPGERCGAGDGEASCAVVATQCYLQGSLPVPCTAYVRQVQHGGPGRSGLQEMAHAEGRARPLLPLAAWPSSPHPCILVRYLASTMPPILFSLTFSCVPQHNLFLPFCLVCSDMHSQVGAQLGHISLS